MSLLFIFIVSLYMHTFATEIVHLNNLRISPTDKYHSTASSLKFQTLFNSTESPVSDNSGKNQPFISFDISAEFYSSNSQSVFLVIGLREKILKDANIIDEKFLHCESLLSLKRQYLDKDILISSLSSEDTVNGQSHQQGKMVIENSGAYASFFVACGGEVAISGEIRYKNTFGYLPGHKYFYLNFYNSMLALYLAIMAFWMYLCLANSKDLFFHHHCISTVLLISFSEIFFNNIEYHYFNKYGVRNVYYYGLASIFTLLRNTLSRALLVLVCSGYGVIRLNFSLYKAFLLYFICFSYFSLNFAHEAHHYSNFEATSAATLFQTFISFVIFLFNSSLYIWVFFALSRTLHELKCYEKHHLRVYRNFAILLLLSLISATIFSLCQHRYNQDVLEETHWKEHWWYEGGFWMILFTVLLMCIIYLWWPTKNILYKHIPLEKSFVDNSMLERSSGEEMEEEEERINSVTEGSVIGNEKIVTVRINGEEELEENMKGKSVQIEREESERGESERGESEKSFSISSSEEEEEEPKLVDWEGKKESVV